MLYFCISALGTNLQKKRKIVFIRILNCIKIDQIIVTLRKKYLFLSALTHYITIPKRGKSEKGANDELTEERFKSYPLNFYFIHSTYFW